MQASKFHPSFDVSAFMYFYVKWFLILAYNIYKICISSKFMDFEIFIQWNSKSKWRLRSESMICEDYKTWDNWYLVLVWRSLGDSGPLGSCLQSRLFLSQPCIDPAPPERNKSPSEHRQFSKLRYWYSTWKLIFSEYYKSRNIY